MHKAHRVVVDMSMVECNIRWILEKIECISFFEKGNSKTMQGVRKGAGQYCPSSICNF